MEKVKLRVEFFLFRAIVVCLLFNIGISAHAQNRPFREHEIVDVGNGQKVEILTCRGEGSFEECDCIYFTTKRQLGTRSWQNANTIRDQERASKLAANAEKLRAAGNAATVKGINTAVYDDVPKAKGIKETPASDRTNEIIKIIASQNEELKKKPFLKANRETSKAAKKSGKATLSLEEVARQIDSIKNSKMMRGESVALASTDSSDADQIFIPKSEYNSNAIVPDAKSSSGSSTASTTPVATNQAKASDNVSAASTSDNEGNKAKLLKEELAAVSPSTTKSKDVSLAEVAISKDSTNTQVSYKTDINIDSAEIDQVFIPQKGFLKRNDLDYSKETVRVEQPSTAPIEKKSSAQSDTIITKGFLQRKTDDTAAIAKGLSDNTNSSVAVINFDSLFNHIEAKKDNVAVEGEGKPKETVSITPAVDTALTKSFVSSTNDVTSPQPVVKVADTIGQNASVTTVNNDQVLPHKDSVMIVDRGEAKADNEATVKKLDLKTDSSEKFPQSVTNSAEAKSINDDTNSSVKNLPAIHKGAERSATSIAASSISTPVSANKDEEQVYKQETVVPSRKKTGSSLDTVQFILEEPVRDINAEIANKLINALGDTANINSTSIISTSKTDTAINAVATGEKTESLSAIKNTLEANHAKPKKERKNKKAKTSKDNNAVAFEQSNTAILTNSQQNKGAVVSTNDSAKKNDDMNTAAANDKVSQSAAVKSSFKDVENVGTAKNQTTDLTSKNSPITTEKVIPTRKHDPLPFTMTAEVNVKGTWRNAIIVDKESELLYKVHYAGKNSADDEWVPAGQLRNVDSTKKIVTCSFAPPAPAVSNNASFSDKVAKRKIYENVISAAGWNKKGRVLGVSFLYFQTEEPFVNTMATSEGKEAVLRNTLAPANAMIYPLRTRFTICERIKGEVTTQVVDRSYSCFKSNDGKWVCAFNRE